MRHQPHGLDLELAAELPSRHIHSPVHGSRSYLHRIDGGAGGHRHDCRDLPRRKPHPWAKRRGSPDSAKGRKRHLMSALKAQLEQLMAKISSKSSIGKAAAYTLGHWQGLTAFLEDGRIRARMRCSPATRPAGSKTSCPGTSEKRQAACLVDRQSAYE
ncbi:IS66 family transposase [Cereibacter changlensis]|uniref:IS66 family transposase n=1 Tax=Cereibacter changlensis TaxID=402884 RepID=UPI003CCC6D22